MGIMRYSYYTLPEELDAIDKFADCFDPIESCKLIDREFERIYADVLLNLKTRFRAYETKFISEAPELKINLGYESQIKDLLERNELLNQQLSVQAAIVRRQEMHLKLRHLARDRSKRIIEEIEIVHRRLDVLQDQASKEIKAAKSFLITVKPIFDRVVEIEDYIFKFVGKSALQVILFALIKTVIILITFILFLLLDDLVFKIDYFISHARPFDHHLISLFLVFLVQIVIIDFCIAYLKRKIYRRQFTKDLISLKNTVQEIEVLDSEFESLILSLNL
jgi:hypothetical protein